MRGLIRTLSPRGRGEESGAVLVMVAVLTTTLVAMASLVVDVGSVLDERRQLQNGADAAALAVAHSCALGSCDPTLAPALADQNTRDGAAAVDGVEVDGSQVKVTTSTRASGGGTILPYSFAQALTGEAGKTVHATATATWSGLQRADVIPLAISLCEWDRATAGGTSFNTTFTGPPTVIFFHTGGPAGQDCAAGPGHDSDGDQRLPGGFGWMEGSDCSVNIAAGGVADEKPGASAPSDCDPSTLLGKTILLPIFDDVNGLGGVNGRYHIAGFGALRITGFRFPGTSAGTPRPCASPTTCIGGYFTRYVTPAEAVGGPDLGATSVILVS